MSAKVAIVDYGMGNLYSVLRACEHVGIPAEITNDPAAVKAAPAVILPGVGAFEDAMKELDARKLTAPLKDAPASGRPFFGICLGLQLMMEKSFEFGTWDGLGLVKGTVTRFEAPVGEEGEKLKVPQVGWNTIHRPGGEASRWKGSLLEDLPDASRMYFVHSYYVRPTDAGVVASTSRYGQIDFCSSVRVDNLFGCQWHPERSGTEGLQMYRNFARAIENGTGNKNG